jgi:hypothetical protein
VWKVIVALEEVGVGRTFKEACKIMYDAVKKMVQEGTSLQVLETAVWIENTGNNPSPVMFYDAKDIACEQGWIQNREWVE